jgi:hypothetical protein
MLISDFGGSEDSQLIDSLLANDRFRDIEALKSLEVCADATLEPVSFSETSRYLSTVGRAQARERDFATVNG